MIIVRMLLVWLILIEVCLRIFISDFLVKLTRISDTVTSDLYSR